MIKTAQLQIRVTPAQKRALKRAAERAGRDMSSYVLDRVLPAAGQRFSELVEDLGVSEDRRFVLASLNDLLSALTPTEFEQALEAAEIRDLDPYLQNYLCAMVEHTAQRLDVPAPSWTRDVEPLPEPHFATPLRSLRLHLLRSSPVAFRRRNLFVDSSIGDRV